ncbi:hypothetical protein B0T24DRAFT_638767 [Lasiosphaeria ovina]|uniref:Uncharacterized protein n=1 Tax=Lasiosphaeria ovina TaxID=92902 RepID=A0AAE0MZS0_9PEZI|nr:hypothetical protein B0T24DRAFT_638767 [Lasiosphaeria ovina]
MGLRTRIALTSFFFCCLFFAVFFFTGMALAHGIHPTYALCVKYTTRLGMENREWGNCECGIENAKSKMRGIEDGKN